MGEALQLNVTKSAGSKQFSYHAQNHRIENNKTSAEWTSIVKISHFDQQDS